MFTSEDSERILIKPIFYKGFRDLHSASKKIMFTYVFISHLCVYSYNKMKTL